MTKLTDAELETLWDEGSDVPAVYDDGDPYIDADWPGTPFVKGDPIDEIWAWFDAQHSKGVGWLMVGRFDDD